MGVNLKALTSREEIALEELKNRICVVDGYNILYQFLSTIRQPDGTPLKDPTGRVTSHIIGLFYRTTKLLQHGIKLVFVFDGKPPKLKQKEIERRIKLKEEAKKAYEIARQAEDLSSMKKYSMRTSKLTKEMVEEAKEILSYLGIPCVQAPCEGEAQMSYMVKEGDAWCGVSQDYDSLLYGCTRLVQNLSIVGKRKMPGSPRMINVVPQLIKVRTVLDELELTLEQLRALSMLVGTDYNPGGVKGLGPKKGLKLVKEFGEDFEGLFEKVEFNEKCEVPWKDIWNTFENMEVTSDYDLNWNPVDGEGLKQFLLDRAFSEDRIDSTLEKLNATKKQRQQTSLGDF